MPVTSYRLTEIDNITPDKLKLGFFVMYNDQNYFAEVECEYTDQHFLYHLNELYRAHAPNKFCPCCIIQPGTVFSDIHNFFENDEIKLPHEDYIEMCKSLGMNSDSNHIFRMPK